MQRDEELEALERLEDELGSKGYKLELLLNQGLEQLDPIDALQKLRDVQVSQYMEEQISTLQSKGYKLFVKRIDDVETPEEEQIRMQLRKLRETLIQMKVKKLKMEAADTLTKFEEVKNKIKVLKAARDNIPIADVGVYSGADIPIALPGLKLRF